MTQFATGALGQGMILVVDDEPRNRRLLDAMLVPGGYQVFEAASGEKALELLDRQHVDLVLLDVMMPGGIDGIETCHRIRQRPTHAFTPVVFTTALTDRDVRVRAKAVGADDFLAKPVDEIELLVRVRNLVLVKRYREQLELANERLEREVKRRTAELRRTVERLAAAERAIFASHEITVQRLARAAEFRDDATARHIQRMSLYCALLARRIGFDEERCEVIRVAASLHDVGKIGISDQILFKSGPLTAEERETIKQHTEFGYRILSGTDSPLLDLAAKIALTHHEKYDGTGYPRGLSGNDIPLEGRIAAIADVFDALTSQRVYKRAFSVEESLEMLRAESSKHFDPGLLDTFFSSRGEVVDIMFHHQDG